MEVNDINDLIYPTVSKELERERMRCMAEMSEWSELSELIPKENFFTKGNAVDVANPLAIPPLN